METLEETFNLGFNFARTNLKEEAGGVGEVTFSFASGGVGIQASPPQGTGMPLWVAGE